MLASGHFPGRRFYRDESPTRDLKRAARGKLATNQGRTARFRLGESERFESPQPNRERLRCQARSYLK